jgi:PBSX family phage terminase large subunit
MAKKVMEVDPLLAISGYKIIFHPHGAVKEVFMYKGDEVLLAGPAGTGKTLGILHKIHLILSKYKKAKAFMSRKTRVSMTNSCLATFQNKVIQPADKVHFHKGDQVFNYPNGSMFAVIGLDDPERIKSTEWDIGYINEATECTENDWEICTTRLRNWILPYQQMIGDCNPDKPTHWLKKRCDAGKTKMLMSFHQDNPRLFNTSTNQWTVEGQVYLAKLMNLSGVRRSRLYAGHWVAAEGMIYDLWDTDKHLISRSQLPEGWEYWPHFWSIDWGYKHPFCWQDWIEDPITGSIYLVREIYRTKRTVMDHALQIMDLIGDSYRPYAIICDHDAGDRASFEQHTGLLTAPAYKHISIGIQAVQRRVRNVLDDKDGPGIFIVRDCLVEVDKELQDAGLPTCTAEEIDGYVWDEEHNRKVNSKKDELPIDKDNHGCDAKRYMVAFMDSLADDPHEFEETLINDDIVTISNY